MDIKRYSRVMFTLLCFFYLTACTSENIPDATSLSPVALKVGEGFENPLGYYEKVPRFSWQINSLSQSVSQGAYQIQVASDSGFSADATLWDSGRVESADTAWIKYAGRELHSRNEVFWRVRFWDENGQQTPFSAIESFELGLLSNADWQAKWIGHPDTLLAKQPSQDTLATAQYLRKPFELKGEIEKARLYVSAKGVFKAFINGQDIAPDDVLTPGWTPYKKRIESLTYDVTDLVKEGENVFASKIAGGWYAGRIADLTKRDHLVPARFLGQLEITFKDGSKQVIVSDDSWQTTLDGPIRFASIYDGEKYDQSKEMPNWHDVGFRSGSATFKSAIAQELESNVLIFPKRHTPIRRIESLNAQLIVSDASSHSKGVVIYDFGQNMVGVPRVSIPATAGQEIRIRYAEALHKGEFYTDNYRSAVSSNFITPSENAVIEYEPTFTYHGYRYIEISGFDTSQTPKLDWAKAIIQHSDIEMQNSFTSNHKKLNKLTQNIQWGLKSNFFDIPLDCPQRDERLGWTGDAQVFATPSMYLADVYGFWSAWLQSVREEQTEDGKIPLYIPFVNWINWASSGWGDAATIIPYELYMLTGDKQILSDNYQMMQQWLAYHEKNATNHISSMQTFGDWLQPFAATTEKNDGNRGDTNFSLISTAFYAHSVDMTLKTAKALGHTQDVQSLQSLHDEIKTAFNRHFFDEALNLKIGKPTQTSYLLALAFNLFEEDKIALGREKLLEQVAKADEHLRTGFLGTPLLLSELQKAGHSDLAYQILFNESYPSWFYSINNGATTTWERWNSYSLEDGFNPQGMNSLNHYAYGSVARWFYEGILGINPVEAGFARIRIEPQFSQRLKNVSGHYDTPNGRVAVAWKYTLNDNIELNLSVPKNTTADFVIPASMTLVDSAQTEALPFGDYTFNLTYK